MFPYFCCDPWLFSFSFYLYILVHNNKLNLLHSDIFTHLFSSSSTACPIGHEHIGRSHIAGGKGLLQVAFTGRQSENVCPSTGHVTTAQNTMIILISH